MREEDVVGEADEDDVEEAIAAMASEGPVPPGGAAATGGPAGSAGRPGDGTSRDGASRTPPPPPPPPTGSPIGSSSGPQAPRIRRDTAGGMVAGVAAGLARHLAIDVVWVRLAFVLTTVFAGGLGLVAYIAAWIIIPADGDSQAGPSGWTEPRPGRGDAYAGQVPDGVHGARSWVGIGLIALGAAVLLDRLLGPLQARLGWVSPIQLLVPLALILAGTLLWRSSRDGTALGGPAVPTASDAASQAPPQAPPQARSQTLSQALSQEGSALPGWQQEAVAHSPVVTSRSTGPATLGIALVVGGAVWLLASLGIEAATPTRALASALLVVGAGLVVGAFVGRGRGLIGVGLLLAPIVLIASLAAATEPGLRAVTVADDGVVVVGPDARVVLQPDDLADVRETYAFGIGSIVLDLSAIDPDQLAAAGTTDITIELGIGDLQVVLPDGADVTVTVSLGIGRIDLLGRTTGGLGVDADRTIAASSPDAGALTVTIEQGIGRVEVTR